MRDQFLAAVKARLERISTAEDPTLALEPGAFDDAQRLAEVLNDDDGDVEARYVLGWFYWYQYLALPEGQDRDALNAASRALTLGFIADAGPLPEPLLASLAENAIGTAITLLKQAQKTTDLTLITTTASLWRRVLNATPADHPDRASRLSNLGLALQTRFERAGEQPDLDEAITSGRAAVQGTPVGQPNRAMYLSNLSLALRARLGQAGDLDEAIRAARAAVQATPADHPNRAMYLSRLGGALQIRFWRAGAEADLEQAITATRLAVQATPVDHPDRAMYLSNLGGALQIKFEQTGALADLDEAIRAARAAVQATPADHPNQAATLYNLGRALQIRFERVGALADLDEAIRVGRAAVQATPADHPNDAAAAMVSNLGRALQIRFERGGELADLDEAIRGGRAAVQATPVDHPNWAGRLSNLSIALQIRFERGGALADLDEAIRGGRAAVQATPVDHPDRAMYLSNLGIGLRTRFKRARAQADLDEAITTYTQAAGAESAAPMVRIRAARSAASLSAQTDTQGAAELLEAAVRLLPETASRRLNRDDQQYALGGFAGLASDAAAVAFLADNADSSDEPAARALWLLELGRGIMLSQVLDTRSDLTDLQARYPALAARFIELRDQLDQAADTLVLAEDAGMAAEWGERRVEDRHQLAAAFSTTVAEIRDQYGFETFQLPPAPDQLICHAQHGPVVIVNVSRHRSDAIMLTPEGITSIPLPGLAQDALIDRINSFHQALGTAHDPDASPDKRIGAQDTLSTVLEWLWDDAARPILDELGYQRTPVPGTAWPRLWWVPGGLLGLLPIHAAGYHREPPGPDALFVRLV